MCHPDIGCIWKCPKSSCQNWRVFEQWRNSPSTSGWYDTYIYIYIYIHIHKCIHKSFIIIIIHIQFYHRYIHHDSSLFIVHLWKQAAGWGWLVQVPKHGLLGRRPCHCCQRCFAFRQRLKARAPGGAWMGICGISWDTWIHDKGNIYIYIHIYIYYYICIYMIIHVYVYVCICMYMYVYVTNNRRFKVGT